jgi:hypothetical protein
MVVGIGSWNSYLRSVARYSHGVLPGCTQPAAIVDFPFNDGEMT